MLTPIEKMIVTLMPDAIPGIDFQIVTPDGEHPKLEKWNSAKLGPMHSLEEMRKPYMDLIRMKKRSNPMIDDADPMPWLNAPKVRRSVMMINNPSPIPDDDMPQLMPDGFIVRKVSR